MDDPLVILGPGGDYREAYMPDGNIERWEPEAATEAREERRDSARKEARIEQLQRQIDELEVEFRAITKMQRQIDETEKQMKKGKS